MTRMDGSPYLDEQRATASAVTPDAINDEDIDRWIDVAVKGVAIIRKLRDGNADLLATLRLIASRAVGCQMEPHDALSGEPVPEFVAVNEIFELARAAVMKAEGR